MAAADDGEWRTRLREWAAERGTHGPYVASDPGDPPEVVRVCLADGTRYGVRVSRHVLLSSMERAAASLPGMAPLHERSRTVLRDRVDGELLRYSAREAVRSRLAADGLLGDPPTPLPRDLPPADQTYIARQVVRMAQLLECARQQGALARGDRAELRTFLREWLHVTPTADTEADCIEVLWETLGTLPARRLVGDLLAYVSTVTRRGAQRRQERAEDERRWFRAEGAERPVSLDAVVGEEPVADDDTEGRLDWAARARVVSEILDDLEQTRLPRAQQAIAAEWRQGRSGADAVRAGRTTWAAYQALQRRVWRRLPSDLRPHPAHAARKKVTGGV